MVGSDRLTQFDAFTTFFFLGEFQTQTPSSSFMSLLIANIPGLATYYKYKIVNDIYPKYNTLSNLHPSVHDCN